ncbi:hypothetical protein SAMN05443634_1054 [Chishuiella changwenlii]|uniref:DUF3592 domain-containing protein n=1 Tax=Chishuiella changwenlii TaxID=1434701 RepID=A0A1M6WVK2_9FLAO|nr:hypothetical protein [Chishuiella changwenlii]GGE98994.1 hypothetical protein GCM10010984_15720 [Chishuiella changwenlii]SHK97686.1 hypothetical protein SAMN05443634_1054 [Chishuiella changwenlii]
MKLSIGIGFVLISLGLISLCYFLNFEIFFNQILGLFFILSGLFFAYLGLKFIFAYSNYNRLIKKGFKVKAHITEIKRTLLGEGNLPDYVIEVFYKHPDNQKIYHTEFEYFGDVNSNNLLKKGKEVDILIDPQDPENIYYESL